MCSFHPLFLLLLQNQLNNKQFTLRGSWVIPKWCSKRYQCSLTNEHPQFGSSQVGPPISLALGKDCHYNEKGLHYVLTILTNNMYQNFQILQCNLSSIAYLQLEMMISFSSPKIIKKRKDITAKLKKLLFFFFSRFKLTKNMVFLPFKGP